MRETAIRENMNKLRGLQEQYQGKIKILRSEKDVSSVNMDAVMSAGSGGIRSFDNADSNMIDFLKEQLGAGKEVAILPQGKTKLMFVPGFGIF